MDYSFQNCLDQNHYQKTLSFLNSHLRENVFYSIQGEYPTILSPENQERMLTLTLNMEESSTPLQILSHAAYYPFKAIIRGIHFNIAGIGSVVTHPEYRGKKLGSKLISQLLMNINKEKFDLSILWTDLFAFYENFNFKRVGRECHLYLTSEELAKLKFNSSTSSSSLEIKRYKIGSEPNRKLLKEVPSLLKLYEKGYFNIIRNQDMMRSYLKIPNSQIFLAFQKGTLISYMIMGKGADLHSYIHEWAGNVNGLKGILVHLSQQVPNSNFTLLFPELSLKNEAQEDHLPYILQDELANVSRFNGYLGMIHIHCPVSFWRRLNLPCDFVLLEANGKFFFKTRKGGDEIISNSINRKEFCSLMFGPKEEFPTIKFKSAIANENWKEVIRKYLPLDFFVWGLDSV